MVLRILNSPEKILNDYHLLFKFIMSKISEAETKNLDESDNGFIENLEILVTSLDYNEMSNDEIFELLEKKKFFDHFGPRHSDEKIRSILIENEQIENRFKNLENDSEKVKQKFELIEMKFKEQSKIISQFQKDLSKFATLQNIEEIISKQKEYEDKLKSIEDKNKNFEMKQKEIEEKNKENELKLKEIEKREIEIEGKIKEYEVKLKQIELKNKFIIIKENEIDEKNKEYENIIKKN